MNKIIEWLYGLKTDKILPFVAALLVAVLSPFVEGWQQIFVR